MRNLFGFKLEQFSHLSGEGFWIVSGYIFVVIGSLVGVRIITELISPKEYGELALALTIATLINQLIFGPLNNGVNRFYSPAIEHGEGANYAQSVYKLLIQVAFGLITLSAFFLFILFLKNKFQWGVIYFISIIYSIFSGYNAVLSGIQNAARQRSVVALHRGMDAFLRVFASVLLVVLVGASAETVLLGYAVSILFVLVSQRFFLKRAISQRPVLGTESSQWRSRILDYSWPFSAFGLFTWMQISSDRWALQHYAGVDEVGMYVVLFQLGYYPVSVIAGIAVQLLAPIFFQHAGDGSDNSRISRVTSMGLRLTKVSLLLTFIAFLVAFLAHRYIFAVFVAQEYSASSFLLPWMILAGGLFASGETVGLNFMSQMKTRAMTLPKLVTAVFGVFLNIVGARLFGVPGVVGAAVLFSATYLAWMLLLSTTQGSDHRVATLATSLGD